MQIESNHQHCTLLKAEPEGRVSFQDGSLQGLSNTCIRDGLWRTALNPHPVDLCMSLLNQSQLSDLVIISMGC